MLSPKEIDHIKALLLSPDSNNVVLATTLLQGYPTAIQQLLLPLEIALTYSDNKALLIDLFQHTKPSIHWRQLPMYAFYTAVAYNTIAEPRVVAEHRPEIRRFIRQEAQYRPYLLADSQKTFLYVDGATFISAEPEFVDKAHEFYQLALQHLPEESYLYYNYADLLRQSPPTGKTLQDLQFFIIDYYKKAYRLEKDKHVLSRLANFYEEDLKDVAQARSTWQYCLQEHPNYVEGQVALAKLEISQQQWKKAQLLLERVLELQATGIWVNLDQVYYLLGKVAWKGYQDSTKALDYYEKALAENRYYAAPLEALLDLSLSTQNFPKAIHWHQVALELQPMNIFLMLQLAKLYRQTENHEKAAEYYREILLLSPHYSPALEGLEELGGF